MTVNGVAVAVGATVTGDYGTLTITSIVGTTVNYSYTLADNVDHDTDLTPFESFTVAVADSDGNPADDASVDVPDPDRRRRAECGGRYRQRDRRRADGCQRQCADGGGGWLAGRQHG